MTTERQRRAVGDQGSVAVELAVLAPAFIFLLLLVVYAGRVSAAETDITRAASAASRAASLRQHPTDATRDAQTTAAANLAASGVACADLATDVDTADFSPGGTVTVTVTCHASMADLALLGLPGTRTFTATAVEVIDRYRSGTIP
jgi:Flp pilus assembly protein TadG